MHDTATGQRVAAVLCYRVRQSLTVSIISFDAAEPRLLVQSATSEGIIWQAGMGISGFTSHGRRQAILAVRQSPVCTSIGNKQHLVFRA